MSRVLIVPGWQGSGPDHWQSDLQSRHPEYERVEQRDWYNVDLEAWVAALHHSITLSQEPVVLVAHSLGCLTIAWWAYLFPEVSGLVSAALLVAPPDLECSAERPEPLNCFPPPPRAAFPFPSVLVGSEDDPYMTIDAAARLAADWDSYFINAGTAGHINPASGFGPWPRGERLLDQLVSWSNARVAHTNNGRVRAA
jgi:predicted alpha/beta hydrolase family esterase